MKYQLINQPNKNLNAKQQILVNRGIDITDICHYMNLTDADINDPEALGGAQHLYNAYKTLTWAIEGNKNICVIVDCDCDGYTSSALMLNYIADMTGNDKYFLRDHLFHFHHESKQHGLSDAMEWLEDLNAELVIIPDAGSNDVEYIRKITIKDIPVIILDHHELEQTDVLLIDKCYIINNQISYPNKELSGVGVVYQFCRYVDKMENTNYANKYLDLVALGNTGDMMSLRSFETRRLISKGLEPDNIKNPFIYGMWQKNAFKLGANPTSWGVTFYIVPLVNAITRSGTIEEKELVFNSMLTYKAFEMIPSNKRGHKLGEEEKLVEQAVRTCTNVKNRQTRAEKAGLELVDHLIVDNNMMDHKVLLFLMKPGQIQPEIRGLIANKLMAKYQRPCCILTETTHEYNEREIEYSKNSPFPAIHYKGEKYTTYEGSARGCDKVGVTEFKDICAETGVCEYTVGHQGAFGLGLRKENIETFIEKTDEALKDMASEPIYYVDYIWSAAGAEPQKILDIADMGDLWGKDMDEALVAIEDIIINKDNITMMASNTVKITLPNGVSIIKFNMADDEYNKLYSKNGDVRINAICRCNANTWNNVTSAQLILEDYEIIRSRAYVF